MKPTLVLPLIVLAGLMPVALAACGQRSSLFAEHAVPTVVPATAQAEVTPRFVGRWAASASQCAEQSMVIQARAIRAPESDCDFDKVNSDSAGYTVAAVCRSGARMNPVRLSIVTPDEAHISTLTISGGPFQNGVPLQRCPAS